MGKIRYYGVGHGINETPSHMQGKRGDPRVCAIKKLNKAYLQGWVLLGSLKKP